MEVYKHCANLIKIVDNKKSNFKNAFFEFKKRNSKIQMRVLKQIYSIALNCLTKINIFKDSFPDTIQIIKRNMTAQNRLKFEIKQRYLFYVLQFELYYSKNKKIRGGGYLPKILKRNKEQIAQIIKKYEIRAGNKDFNF